MNKYMELALKLAKKAYKKGEVPVGVVIVKDNKILSTSFNNRQKKYNVLGHAEITAILKAEKKIKDWRLDGCKMYVTLEPCNMCDLIIKESRIDQVIYLLKNEKKLLTKNKNIKEYTQTNDCFKLQKEYKQLLEDFFAKLR